MRKLIKYSISAAFLLPVLAACQPNKSMDIAMETDKVCREKLFHVIANTENNKISAITEMKDECGEQQVYSYALANTYFKNEKYVQAVEAARNGLKIDNEFNPNLYYVIFHSKFQLNDFQAAKNVAEEALHSMPKNDIGFFLLGTFAMHEENYIASIQNLEKVFSEESVFEAKQHLTIAYYNTNQFKEATIAFENGARLNDVTYLNRQAVLAASASYYEIDNKQAALDVLNRHVELVPESRAHPLVIKMYEILTQPE